jgi:murein DD-endopeptidase MepM/ murein hydrolase activator NlpD
MLRRKNGILAQNPVIQERKIRLRWLLAASSIPLFGIVTAFGLAPQSIETNVPIETVVESITLPQSVDVQASSDTTGLIWQSELIRRDDSLSTLLSKLNIRNDAAIDFLRHAPEASVFASQLRPGKSILAKTLSDGTLVELIYQLNADAVLHVTQSASGYHAKQEPVVLENRTMMKSAEIRSSLFAATDNADIPDHIAMQLADIFSSDIDFNLDLRKGDHFSVVYESSYYNGEELKSGKVLAAEFVNQGKTYRAVLFRDREGRSNYYSPEGKSLHKAFLRSPLEFSRISSGFSLARFHPILQQWRAHKGVDYAAPIGTHIKATSDGTVVFAGTQNGYGNVVFLQHANGISTVYGHMSRFAQGLHKGQKISQGDIIGQVGMSGMATGPHLHYEVRVNGEYRDPLKVALPTAVPLDKSDMAAFSAQSQEVLSQLNLLSRTTTASME